eukprot:3573607-Prymnesium_polylepis.3
MAARGTPTATGAQGRSPTSATPPTRAPSAARAAATASSRTTTYTIITSALRHWTTSAMRPTCGGTRPGPSS